MEGSKLFMLLLGCRPKGRFTEQHDIFFGIGDSPASLIPAMLDSWPEARGNIHVDAWREINYVDGHSIKVLPREEGAPLSFTGNRLYFINLGGYKKNEFEEYHYKLVTVGVDKGVAIRNAKETAFYKHTGFTGATSHVDDKYGIDVDDTHEITDILPPGMKEAYTIVTAPCDPMEEDEIHLGYFKLSKL